MCGLTRQVSRTAQVFDLLKINFVINTELQRNNNKKKIPQNNKKRNPRKNPKVLEPAVRGMSLFSKGYKKNQTRVERFLKTSDFISPKKETTES